MENSIVQVFTHNLIDGHYFLIFPLVFIGGIIASLSPCTLGMIPIIIGYVGGSDEKVSKTTILNVFLFVLGLSAVLTLFGIVSAFTGKVLGFYSNPLWALIIASLIMVMGLSLVEVVEVPVPSVLKSLPKNNNNNFLYPFILGAAFAFAATPCSTPLLAGIMAYTSLKANILLGGFLLFLFSLGQGSILVIAGLFTSLFKKTSVIKPFSGYFVRFSGIMLIIAAALIYIKVFAFII